MSECVYEPSEDTFLLEKLLVALSGTLKNINLASIAEVGSGSGYLTAVLSALFPRAKVVATDLSPYAIMATSKVLDGSPHTLVAECDAGSCISRVDMVVFNPPYLPPSPIDSLIRDHCGGWYLKALSDPESMLYMCLNAAKTARLVIATVYSNRSPIDLRRCLEKRGFRVLISLERPLFFERLYAIAAFRYW